LYLKASERAGEVWEKVPLSRDGLKATEQLQAQLEGWPDHIVYKCKQQLADVFKGHAQVRNVLYCMVCVPSYILRNGGILCALLPRTATTTTLHSIYEYAHLMCVYIAGG
jgi:hypothetical protein